MSVMVSEALRLPLAEGENEVTIVQLLPAAREEPQVLFSVKSEGSEPPSAMLVMLKDVLPEFCNVMLWDELGTSTGSSPKLRLLDERLAPGLPLLVSPVPDRVTV